MDKSLLIVVDSFSDRIFEYDNVTLYDYGYFETVGFIDSYYDVYTGALSGYGNYDDVIISYPDNIGGFYQVTPDDAGFLSSDLDLDHISSGSFLDSFGLTAYYDEYYRFTRAEQNSEATLNLLRLKSKGSVV